MSNPILEVGDVWEYTGNGDVDHETMRIVDENEDTGEVTVAFDGDEDDTAPVRADRWDDLFPHWDRQ